MLETKEIVKSEYIQGLKIMEDNIISLYKVALKAYNENNYRLAYFIAFTIWEELGKAHYLLDNWQNKSIARKDWCSKKTFRGHGKKIARARNALTQSLVEELIRINPQLNPGGGKVIVDYDTKYMEKKYTSLRDSCLHVDYDFILSKWGSPLNMDNIEWESKMLISEIIKTYQFLQHRKNTIEIISP
ncbi:AbiV family abortive infection protein [Candidatus Bathyarchaeota archaeon]|nr:AbiV family abortive infection protein [Candidatus Bathyarchaeota archaeon]